MSTTRARTLNRVLWTAQTLIALLFLFAGSMKFIMSPEQMQQGPIVLPIDFIRFIGTCEILGAFGLVLPGLFRIRTELTSLAAVGLTLIMSGATTISIASMGVSAAIVPFVVGVIAASIAYARTRVVPLSDAPRRVLRAA